MLTRSIAAVHVYLILPKGTYTLKPCCVNIHLTPSWILAVHVPKNKMFIQKRCTQIELPHLNFYFTSVKLPDFKPCWDGHSPSEGKAWIIDSSPKGKKGERKSERKGIKRLIKMDGIHTNTFILNFIKTLVGDVIQRITWVTFISEWFEEIQK